MTYQVFSIGYRRNREERALDVREYFDTHPEDANLTVTFEWVKVAGSGRETTYFVERIPRMAVVS